MGLKKKIRDLDLRFGPVSSSSEMPPMPPMPPMPSIPSIPPFPSFSASMPSSSFDYPSWESDVKRDMQAYFNQQMISGQKSGAFVNPGGFINTKTDGSGYSPGGLIPGQGQGQTRICPNCGVTMVLNQFLKTYACSYCSVGYTVEGLEAQGTVDTALEWLNKQITKYIKP